MQQLRCPNCGTPYNPGDGFCGECGRSLAPAAPPGPPPQQPPYYQHQPADHARAPAQAPSPGWTQAPPARRSGSSWLIAVGGLLLLAVVAVGSLVIFTRPSTSPPTPTVEADIPDVIVFPTLPSEDGIELTFEPEDEPTFGPEEDITAETASDPPRISLDEFKALYDDPDRRPIVVDVRFAVWYDEGHIPDAINVPFDQTDQYLDLLPYDTLIVAYCH